MQDLLFASFLFISYFVAACCLLYTPSRNQQRLEPMAVEMELEPLQLSTSACQDPWEVEESMIIAQPSCPDFDPKPDVEIDTPESLVPESTLEELLEGIDLDSLQLRPARKIAGKLMPPIAQKVNGKDVPLSWLRSQIKSRLSEKPNEVVLIIHEVLRAA